MSEKWITVTSPDQFRVGDRVRYYDLECLVVGADGDSHRFVYEDGTIRCAERDRECVWKKRELLDAYEVVQVLRDSSEEAAASELAATFVDDMPEGGFSTAEEWKTFLAAELLKYGCVRK